tara:strand:- start:455 stop:991 length:537 start_codon:yes stop_codon:yes gene_type:complete
MTLVQRTGFPHVVSFQREAFEDHRGTFELLYNKNAYTPIIKEETGCDVRFMEEDIAVSLKHVLRGIHGDDKTWKMITCLCGTCYFVVVDCRVGTDDFGEWESFTLSEKNRKQILVPPNFGNAYLVMSDKAIIHYKQSCVYEGESHQFNYQYNDDRFHIWWPITNPIISLRDSPLGVKS